MRLEDLRAFPRTPSGDAKQAVLDTGEIAILGSVVDVSPTGVGFESSDFDFRADHFKNKDLTLKWANQALRTRLVHLQNTEMSSRWGLELVREEEPDEIEFSESDSGWDVIDHAQTLSDLFDDLRFKGPECPLLFRVGEEVYPAFVKAVSEDKVTAELIESERVFPKDSQAVCRFEIFQTYHAFLATKVELKNKDIHFDFPKTVVRCLRRGTARNPNPSNGIHVAFRGKSEALGEIHAEVLDFSENGICLFDSTGQLLGPEGMELNGVELLSGGKTIRCEGKLRNHRGDQKGILSGIELFNFKGSGLTDWHNVVLKARYPGLSFDYSAEDHPKIWDLFDRSGYLGLKPKESFQYVYDSSEGAWDGLDRAGTSVSKRVTVRSNDNIVGHLQLDRMYPETWCAHALAIDPSQLKTVGKEIYSVTSDVVLGEEAGYIISITESELKWNKRNYYEFVNAYRWPEENQLKIYQIHEAELSKGWNLSSDPSIVVREATKWDLKRLIRFFDVHLPAIERNALGLSSKDIELEAFSKEIEPYQLFRKRKFLVAYRNDKLLGCVAMETGSSGWSIFGIQDTVYVYINPEVMSEQRSITETLLARTLEKYRDQNIPVVNVYLEDDAREYWTSRGLKFIWEGVRWLCESNVSRSFYAYTNMLYGHLILRREKIRMRKRSKD